MSNYCAFFRDGVIVNFNAENINYVEDGVVRGYDAKGELVFFGTLANLLYLRRTGI